MNSDLVLIKSERFRDRRGYFTELYNRRSFSNYGIDLEFLQDNHSMSKEAGTVRGLHFQAPPLAQAKLVRCSRGAIFDVAVDIRKGSPTYGQWDGFELTADNGHQLFIPIGFAHGFVTLKANSEVVYKCSDYYSPDHEGSVLWRDPDLGIDWPMLGNPVLSDKDAIAPVLSDVESPFIYGENS